MIEFSEYDPQWPAIAAHLIRVLSDRLGTLAMTIEHVGSTAVPGLAAKPILDLDIVIAHRDALPGVIDRLGELGYLYEGDKGIPGREAFARSGDDVPRDGTGRTWMAHHLYVCAADSRELARHVRFRDHLRTHPADADAYAQLKRRLAAHHDDRNAYCLDKTDLIRALIAKIDPALLD